MQLTIRPLQSQDKAGWRQLWHDYLGFYESTVGDTIYDTTFDRLLSEKHTNQNAFLALEGTRTIGLVHYIYHPHNWKVEDVCYLQDLYAVPECRGQGIGRALIEAVYQAADANGTPTVYWLTQDFNHTARQLYGRVATLTPFIKYAR